MVSSESMKKTYSPVASSSMRFRGRAAPPELVPIQTTRKNPGSAARLFSNSPRIASVSGSELPSSAMTISKRSRGRVELITDWRQFRNSDLPLNTGMPSVRSLPDGCGRVAGSRTPILRTSRLCTFEPHRIGL